VGIYSAGLGRRDTDAGITVAGVQSVYRRAAEIGPIDLVIVDEAHEIPPDGEGMYRTLLLDLQEQTPSMRIVGMTATPFRLSGGAICKPDNLLTAVSYEASIRDMIADGFLCKLTSKAGKRHADLSGVHIQGGEFKADEVAAIMDDEKLVRSACSELVAAARNRVAALVFCASIEHAEHVAAEIGRLTGDAVGIITGETPPAERDDLIARIRGEEVMADLLQPHEPLKWLVNVNVLTTGFDAPRIDTVCLMRATMSPGLYVQMVGRGSRLSDGKEDCLILDFGNNIVRHGPVDMVGIQEKATKDGTGEMPGKECPECQEVVFISVMLCPNCGHEWETKPRHEAVAGDESILSGEITDEVFDVRSVSYMDWEKRGDPDAPHTMRVDYEIGFAEYQSEWVCPGHIGYARGKFTTWWLDRSMVPPPTSAMEAVRLAQDGAIAEPSQITVRTVSGEKFKRVIGYVLPGKPEYFMEPGEDHHIPLDTYDEIDYLGDDIPF